MAKFVMVEPQADTLDNAVQCYRAGDLPAAERICRQILLQRPNDAALLHLLGRITHKSGNPDIAAALIRKAVSLEPHHARYHRGLGVALLERGKILEATRSFERALELAPDYLNAMVGLGTALREQGEHERARAWFLKALMLAPDSPDLYCQVGRTFEDRFQHSTAQTYYERARALAPGSGRVLNNLAGPLLGHGRIAEAVDLLRRAVELEPEMELVHSNLLFVLHYLPDCARDVLASEARAWAQRHAASLARETRPHANVADPGRRLRIGYVSADFHRHPVGYFLESVLREHDKSQFEVFLYANHRGVDDLTQRLCGAADRAVSLVGIVDRVAEEVIRRDGIDILVDLSGHTGGVRLPLFARKPAPVQATWIGYFDTTGLEAIDYIILDRFVCPPGDESLYTERVVRLPESYLCYAPQTDNPVAPLPALSRGQVTFGCFNKTAKINSSVVAVWSQILRALPMARLCLKDGSFDDPGVREHFTSLFEEHGVTANRLTFLGWSPYADYLTAYGDIDIGLDPFPFNGGTTTVEALWMGVPVITLAGDHFVSRMGVTHLSAVGLPQLIAESPESYVEKAVSLAGDPRGLAEMRAGLRDRMRRSPLCDAPRFTRGLEAAYRQMWQAWCESATTSKT